MTKSKPPELLFARKDARRTDTRYVDHYNNVRLHSVMGYIAPVDKFRGREKHIFIERDKNWSVQEKSASR